MAKGGAWEPNQKVGIFYGTIRVDHQHLGSLGGPNIIWKSGCEVWVKARRLELELVSSCLVGNSFYSRGEEGPVRQLRPIDHS